MILFQWRHIPEKPRWRGGIPAALRIAFCCMVFFAVNPGSVDGEEIDRLIAAVNGVAITEGDLNLARSLNAVLFYGRNAGAKSRSEDIERLIDQELMRQELKNFSMAEADASEIAARMQSLRNAFAAIGGLSAFLQRTGLQEPELISYVRLESSILKFVDFRFRPFVSVSQEEMRAYYENRLVSQLRESKIEVPPLDQVLTRIEVILREEKINAALDQWMKEVRRSSRIEYFSEDTNKNNNP